jgi:hypothetical protein
LTRAKEQRATLPLYYPCKYCTLLGPNNVS